jgi:hypothetical protein
MIGYNLDNRGSIPDKDRNISLHHQVQTGFCVHSAFYKMDTRYSFSEAKAAGEFLHSPIRFQLSTGTYEQWYAFLNYCQHCFQNKSRNCMKISSLKNTNFNSRPYNKTACQSPRTICAFLTFDKILKFAFWPANKTLIESRSMKSLFKPRFSGLCISLTKSISMYFTHRQYKQHEHTQR